MRARWMVLMALVAGLLLLGGGAALAGGASGFSDALRAGQATMMEPGAWMHGDGDRAAMHGAMHDGDVEGMHRGGDHGAMHRGMHRAMEGEVSGEHLAECDAMHGARQRDAED